MKLSELNNAGHWPTLLAAFLYFDFTLWSGPCLVPWVRRSGKRCVFHPNKRV
jgi:hypothetical protein